MDTKEILPVLDMEKLKLKSQEAAMKGAISEVEEFYTGYNSPFRKKIKEQLEGMEVNSHNIQLPEIIGLINDSLSAEIDTIANQAVSKSFIPLVKKFLTRAEKKMKFSELLQQIVNEEVSPEQAKYSCTAEHNAKYDWFDVTITADGNEYKLTLHQSYDSKKLGVGKERYHILNLPSHYDKRDKMMKITIGDAKLELPFTTDILQDNIISLVARLIMADTEIEMDTDDFSEDMFPEKCHC